MRVCFITFGCRLNRAEALDAEARFVAAGHEIVSLGDAPDCIVVRACSVTAKAERDCRKEIKRLERSCPRVVVTGCFPDAVREIPLPETSRENNVSPIPQTTSRAYLKVQDGCSGRCTYCIVPRFRGAPRSEPLDAILARARAFLQAGYRELIVTGCNLALWRDGEKSLPDLVAALAEMPPPGNVAAKPVHRVRLGSLEPCAIVKRLIPVLATRPNVCRHLHLSLQSASDSVLRRMGRIYGNAELAAFCSAARHQLGPRLALGADVIAGFPGETEDDFAATRTFLAAQGFVHVHAFPYSERPDTPAATFSNAVPVAERRRRATLLAADATDRRNAFAAGFVGKEVVVCAENDGFGWTEERLRCGPLPDIPRRALATVCIARIDENGTLVPTH